MNLIAKPSKENIKTYLPIGVVLITMSFLDVFVNAFFSYNLLFIKKKNINFFYEDLHLIFYFLFVVAIFLLFFSFNQDFSINLLSLSSSMSNIGFSLGYDQSNLNFIYDIVNLP